VEVWLVESRKQGEIDRYVYLMFSEPDFRPMLTIEARASTTSTRPHYRTHSSIWYNELSPTARATALSH
jgi:hypothetical protein